MLKTNNHNKTKIIYYEKYHILELLKNSIVAFKNTVSIKEKLMKIHFSKTIILT
ncbi:hypothetical protein LEP1GSC041_1084 [Leptospira noguchii str. 2006001870]|nr:hypothetical protein LEP1GSC041_1084 [Leptospira noguchii str. 2006001870]